MSVNLTPEQKDQITEALSQLRRIEDEIERAERAGLDMSGYRQQATELRKLADGLNREYVVGQRRRR